jgi:diguanylate cyclase (GGDEF)-like protein/PAS domain S-box-containing protein
MNYVAFISLGCSLISLFMGFMIYALDKKSLQNRMFSFLCVSLFINLFSIFMWRQSTNRDQILFWYKIYCFFPIIIALSFHFVLVFIGKRKWLTRKIVFFLIYVPALITSLFPLFAPDFVYANFIDDALAGSNKLFWEYTAVAPAPTPESLIVIGPILIWMQGTMILTIVMCIRFLLKTANQDLKNQMKFLTLGMIVHFTGGILSNGLVPVIFNSTVPEIDPLSKALMAVLIGYGIWKYQLFKLNLTTAADNILKMMKDAMILFTQQCKIVAVNPSLTNLLEYKEADLIGQPVQMLFKEQHFFDKFFENINRTGIPADYDLNFSTKSDRHIPIIFSTSVIRDNKENIAGAVGIAKDISERKRSEEKISHLAYYDPLTQLPNRSLFFEYIKSALAIAKRHKRLCALLFLDIDDFKRINDSLGHDTGDILLKEVADRLRKCVRKEDTISRDSESAMIDTVARLGGDEFTILLFEINSPENASRLAERIREILLPPFILKDKKINITVSIGIAIYPLDGTDMETLIKNADIAMYSAKVKGKNNFQYVTTFLTTTSILQMTLENELRHAFENNELKLYYQPIFDLKTKKIVCVETLLRWEHPQKGVIPPMDFIPVAEQTGLIIPIGDWILKSALTQYSRWQTKGLPEIDITVNISPKQLTQGNLIGTTVRLLNDFKLQPQHLIMEITENCIIQNLEETNNTIKALHSLGVKTALDDFGSGYVSFLNLKQLLIDILKIDQSLIRNIPDNVCDTTIVSSLINIGHSMHLQVIAEGIEEEKQLSFLKEQSCDLGQGFYLGRPVSEADFAKLWET